MVGRQALDSSPWCEEVTGNMGEEEEVGME